MLIVLAAVLAMGGAVQVVAIIRLVILRKRLGRLPHLSKQPSVRTWMRVSRSVAAICILATIAALVTAKEAGEPFLLGLVPVVLTLFAHIAADNDAHHGDGDSGE